jgi:hypothetical protein
MEEVCGHTKSSREIESREGVFGTVYYSVTVFFVAHSSILYKDLDYTVSYS